MEPPNDRAHTASIECALHPAHPVQPCLCYGATTRAPPGTLARERAKHLWVKLGVQDHARHAAACAIAVQCLLVRINQRHAR